MLANLTPPVVLTAFIVPYIFVYSPSLLLIDTTILNPVFCLVMFVSALTLIKPGLMTDILGIGIFVGIAVIQMMSQKKNTAMEG